MPSPKRLRLLSLDGGGAKAWTQIVLLKQVVYQVKLHFKHAGDELNDENLYPCDYFDLIVGSGTGGANAIMIGRLGMSIKKIEEAWKNLNKVLGVQPSSPGSETPLLDSSKLEKWAKDLVREYTGSPDTRMREDGRQNNNNRSCKNVAVTVMRASNMGPSTVFRTYNVRENAEGNPRIWEAIRATMASPLLYPPIAIGDNEWERQEFTNAELGVNNPASVTLHESGKIWRKEGNRPALEPGCIVSIGTGKSPISIPQRSLLSTLINYIWPMPEDPMLTREKQYAEDTIAVTKSCEKKHQEMKSSFNWDTENSGVYFRLNVEQGMQMMGETAWYERARLAMNVHAINHIQHADYENDFQDLADKLYTLSSGQKQMVRY